MKRPVSWEPYKPHLAQHWAGLVTQGKSLSALWEASLSNGVMTARPHTETLTEVTIVWC